jgi:cyclophilin family peptidyl-prolyl cis-trans isomerase
MKKLFSLLFVPLFAFASPLAAQQAETQAPAEVVAFNKILDQFRTIPVELKNLQQQAQTADASQLAELQEKFTILLKTGEELQTQLLPAAEKAFAAMPSGEQMHTKVLVDHVEHYMRAGNLAEASRIVKLLVDGKVDDPALLANAAIVSLGMNDTQTAAERLKAAVAKADPDLKELNDKILREIEFRTAEAAANDLPRVKLETSKGTIVIELYENEAPNTVANFISLVEKGFYNGLKFHRVIESFMAQGGCPQGTGGGGPGYNIPCECYEAKHREHFCGTLSMAHAGRDTGGSQFFLTFGPTEHLDGKHTAFGRVIEGMDVLGKLNRTEPVPAKTLDVIEKATVVRKREHAYTPKTLPEK